MLIRHDADERQLNGYKLTLLLTQTARYPLFVHENGSIESTAGFLRIYRMQLDAFAPMDDPMQRIGHDDIPPLSFRQCASGAQHLWPENNEVDKRGVVAAKSVADCIPPS